MEEVVVMVYVVIPVRLVLSFSVEFSPTSSDVCVRVISLFETLPVEVDRYSIRSFYGSSGEDTQLALNHNVT